MSLSVAVINVAKHRRYARKARDYIQAYIASGNGDAQEAEDHVSAEKIRRAEKTKFASHRSCPADEIDDQQQARPYEHKRKIRLLNGGQAVNAS